jgi:glucose/arabinose dehydrogenase
VLETFFALPWDAEPFRGDLLVAELGTGSVVRAELPDLAVRETIASGLIFPAGLATNGDDAYVSDAVLGTVFQFIRGGEVLPVPEPVATGLAGPEGIALRSGGNRLLVVEGATSSLKEIHLQSGTVKTIATDLGFQPPFLPTLPLFNDVDVDSTGAMYVNSDGDNVIYKIRSHGNAD